MENQVKYGTCLLLVLFINQFSVFGQESDFKDDQFEVGQIWSYETRETEDSSTITIVAIENSKKEGIVISVFIDGLKIKNPSVEGGMNLLVPHLPFSKAAISSSVIKLKDKTDKLPPYEEEYDNWKEDFDAGRAGIFKVPLKVAIQQMEDVINPPKKVKAKK